MQHEGNQIKFIIIFAALNEACNKLAGSISTLLRLSTTTPFEEMSQWWRAIGNTVFHCPDLDLNLRDFTPDTNAIPHHQLTAKRA